MYKGHPSRHRAVSCDLQPWNQLGSLVTGRYGLIATPATWAFSTGVCFYAAHTACAIPAASSEDAVACVACGRRERLGGHLYAETNVYPNGPRPASGKSFRSGAR